MEGLLLMGPIPSGLKDYGNLSGQALLPWHVRPLLIETYVSAIFATHNLLWPQDSVRASAHIMSACADMAGKTV